MSKLKHTPEKAERRTTVEIKAEIVLLKSLEGKLPQLDAFGGNNWKLLKAQLKVLKGRLGMDDIRRLWSDDDDAQGAAEDARYWMDGGEVFSPFQYWQDVKNGIKNTV